MKTPWQTWWAMGCVVLLATASLGWLSRAVLRLDAGQRRMAEEGQREELVRLALWRMDSALALLVADENARAPEEFSAFHPPYRAWSTEGDPLATQGILIPSGLLGRATTHVQLHFEWAPGRGLGSPRVPEENQRVMAAMEGLELDEAKQAATQLKRLREILGGGSGGVLEWEGSPVGRMEDLMTLAAAEPGRDRAMPVARSLPEPAKGPMNSQVENYSQLNQQELLARGNNLNNSRVQNRYATKADSAVGGPVTEVGGYVPAWIAEELFLVRRVRTATGDRLQGVWLDWVSLRRSLLESIADIVPDGGLIPVTEATPAPDERRLVAFPARLIPGPIIGLGLPRWTALRMALVAGWVGVGLAVAAMMVLLRGVLLLSERRAEFVSAVTHELRTPLTTFQLYSGMLADGMVTDPEQRRLYLATLCAESGRLGRLVENVLVYARLERGSARNRLERMSLEELVRRIQPRLETRLAEAGLSLRINLDPGRGDQQVEVDAGVVEQVLFNLADNAAKYAAGNAAEPVVHLEEVTVRGNRLGLRMRDHGPGVARDVAARLFTPFHRSAEEAAGSAPGVGLGLALSRNLARSLGGDLRLDPGVKDGAAFVVELPMAGKDRPGDDR